MFYAFICSICAISALLLVAMGSKIMQVLQLSSYRARGVIGWCKRTRFDYIVRYFSAAFFSFISMLMYVGCFWRYRYVRYLGLLFYLVFCVLFVILTVRQKSKTPLRFTPRIVRLTILSFILFFFASFGLMVAVHATVLRYAFLGLMPLAVPLIVLLAHYILLPFETLNNMRYLRRAAKKLQSMPHLIRVGITGSYGKTTAKHILAAMLEKQYRVSYSPASFNTPLGIARTVNDSLPNDAQVLIAEMGARYRGDVKELCKLVQPSVGIVTAVGNQHLETFGSIEEVANTKYELIEGLALSGLGVFSADNAYTRAMYEKATCEKRLAGASGEGVFVGYDDVSFTEDGTRFTLVFGSTRLPVTSKLLGRHIPQLCAICAAAALELGVSGAQIAEAIAEMPPVEHRLQLIENGDVTVLDDAYNSNPAGAANALEVLCAFEGTHIIITPGLVELGKAEADENYALGKTVAAFADLAYFVGKNAEALKKGATDGGMPEDKIFVCASRDDAVTETTHIAGKKVILFENDLPDHL